jgi:hypothetical protein
MIRCEMPEDLKRFEAVLGEWAGLEFRIMTIAFSIEDETGALEVAEDLALLEGCELIHLSKC